MVNFLPTFYDYVTTIENNRQVRVNDINCDIPCWSISKPPKSGTEPGVRKGKHSLLAYHTLCKRPKETIFHSVKVLASGQLSPHANYRHALLSGEIFHEI